MSVEGVRAFVSFSWLVSLGGLERNQERHLLANRVLHRGV